ncbi:MAG: hypothetical protein IKZ97_01895 [Butyrivibrio sp.]|nr:hypothetical protein [Butyrivibrio sp.]
MTNIHTPINNRIYNFVKRALSTGSLFVTAALLITSTLLVTSALLTGCGNSAHKKSAEKPAPAPYEAKDFLQESQLTKAGEDIEEAAKKLEPARNYDTELSVPTYITKVDDAWFIVDCYHNRVIYSKELGTPLDNWFIMSSDATQPHTMASDGHVYLIDDTENNRVLIYEKKDDKFLHTQSFYDIGTRPHYTVYDEATDTFYVWSSMTGELFCFRREDSTNRVYLTDKRAVLSLFGVYVRSFSIIDGDIYFVSSVSSTGADAKILRCDLETLEVKKEYAVPDELAGMVQITEIGGTYYITTSTDKSGGQEKATIVQASSLENLSKGKYTDIYSEYFIGGGTPYYISKVDDTYFLTEHRIKGHSIWSFKADGKKISSVEAIY